MASYAVTKKFSTLNLTGNKNSNYNVCIMLKYYSSGCIIQNVSSKGKPLTYPLIKPG